MASNLNEITSATAYQALGAKERRRVKRVIQRAHNLGLCIEIQGDELVLHAPSLELEQIRELRCVLNEPEAQMSALTVALDTTEREQRIQWSRKYKHLAGALDYLGINLHCKDDQVTVVHGSKPKVYYYTRLGTPEYPGFERLLTDVAEQILLNAPHLEVELKIRDVSTDKD